MPKHAFATVGWPGYELPEGVSIEDLPITSPFCVDTRCKAFRDGLAAEEQKTPLRGLLKYGTWTVWFYSFWLALFAGIYAYRRAHDRFRGRRSTKTPTRRTSLKDKIIGGIRFLTYRRPSTPFAQTLGLHQISYGTLFLLFLGAAFVAVLPWPEARYLRTLSRFGAPPLSVRCAFIIAALTPLVVALAGKVNVVTWLTGVGYEKLGVWHRGVGWVIWGIGTVHTIPHLMAPVEDGGWSMLNRLYANRARQFSGTMLYAATFGLAVFSLPWMRRRFYEVFKWVHWFFVAGYIGCFWWHCWGERVSPNYIYATVAVLFGTNAVRLLLRHQNLRSFSNLNGFPTTLTQLPENITRVVVEVPKSFTWKSGQYASIRMPNISLLGNHPFFIVNLPEPRQGSSTHEMVFLVRRRKGFTKKLMDAALTPESEVPIKPRVLRSSRALEKSRSVDNGKAPILDIEKLRVRDGKRAEHIEHIEKKPRIGDEKGVEHIECIDHQPDVDRIMVIEEEVATPISPFSRSDYALTGMHPLRKQASASSFPPRDEITEAKLKALAEKPAGVRFSAQTTHTTQTTWRTSTSTKRRSSITSFPPMDEITQHKLLAIANKSGIRASRRTIVDGPYGSHHRPYHRIYDNLVFIAAGTGITAIMPHILDLTDRLSYQTKDESLTPRKLHLVWIMREIECISWVERELLTAVSTMSERPGPSGCSFTVDMYVTRGTSNAEAPPFPIDDPLDDDQVDDELPVLSPEATSPISLDFALDEKKDVRFSLDPEESTASPSLPIRPRPAVRRHNDGRHLFDSSLNLSVFGNENESGDVGISRGGVNIATHYCRPAIKDVVEGYVGGERGLVLTCCPPSLSTELANVVAGLQRRVWNDKMREVALVVERFSL